MKRSVPFLLVAAVALAAGWFMRDLRHPASGIRDQASAPASRAPLFYQSPMHPWIKSDKPGKCTICGMDLAPVYEGGGTAAGAGLVVLGTNSVQALHVATTEAARRPLTRTLRFSGTIDDDDTRHRILSAYTDARIERLHVNFQGAEVVEGQPLATIYSPALLNAAREHLAFHRAHVALSDGRAGTADTLAATASRLQALGLTARQIERLPETFSETNLFFEILSPMTGTVVVKTVYEGQSVKEGEKLFEIADFSTMWFKFDAYERDLASLAPGQAVEVVSAALPGRTFTGRIAFIDPNLDERTRATKVRVELPNPLITTNGALRREIGHRLFAEARVSAVVPDALAAPRRAVLNPGGTPFVYVEKSVGAYERRRVVLGRVGDDVVEVSSGLATGERVVTAGNLLIDSQAQLDSASDLNGHSPTTKTAPLDAAGREALGKVFALASGLAEALAADDLAAFKTRSAGLHTVMPAAAEALAKAAGWSSAIDPANRAAHFPPPGDLATARARFHAFVTPVVELARLARAADAVKAPRIFQCPMTKTVFPNAPTNAFWIQLGEGGLRNPYMGAAMIDCGTEVKP